MLNSMLELVLASAALVLLMRRSPILYLRFRNLALFGIWLGSLVIRIQLLGLSSPWILGAAGSPWLQLAHVLKYRLPILWGLPCFALSVIASGNTRWPASNDPTHHADAWQLLVILVHVLALYFIEKQACLAWCDDGRKPIEVACEFGDADGRPPQSGGEVLGKQQGSSKEHRCVKASFQLAVIGALWGWRHPTLNPSSAGLEHAYKQWRLAKPHVMPKLCLILIAVFHSVLLIRVVPVILVEGLRAETLLSMVVNCALQCSQLLLAALLLRSQRLWAQRGVVIVVLDAVLWVCTVAWMLCPSPGACRLQQVDSVATQTEVYKILFASENVARKMTLVLIWGLVMRVGMMQLPPPWLLVNAVAWLGLLAGCMLAATPDWFVHGDAASWGVPGWCVACVCSAAGVAVAVFFEAQQRMQFLTTEQHAMAAATVVVSAATAGPSVAGSGTPDCSIAHAPAAADISGSEAQPLPPGASPMPTSKCTSDPNMQVPAAAAAQTLPPPKPASPAASVDAAAAAVAAAAAAAAARSAACPLSLKQQHLQQQQGLSVACKPQYSSLYCRKAYSQLVSVKVASDLPLQQLRDAAVAAVRDTMAATGQLHTIMSHVCVRGCWRLIMQVRSLPHQAAAAGAAAAGRLVGAGGARLGGSGGDGGGTGSDGAGTSCVGGFEGDCVPEIAQAFSEQLQGHLPTGTSLLEPAALLSNTEVCALPRPVALPLVVLEQSRQAASSSSSQQPEVVSSQEQGNSTIASGYSTAQEQQKHPSERSVSSSCCCSSSIGAVVQQPQQQQQVCHTSAFVLALPAALVEECDAEGSRLRVVVSLSHGHSTVHEQVWTAAQLRELPVDAAAGQLQVLVGGVQSKRFSLTPDLLPLLVVSVLKQLPAAAHTSPHPAADQHIPDTLLCSCALPLLPPEQCAELCDLFTRMVGELGGDASAAYQRCYQPLVWDLVCALSPAAVAAATRDLGLQPYGNTARHLLRFLCHQSMLSCAEAAATVLCQQTDLVPELCSTQGLAADGGHVQHPTAGSGPASLSVHPARSWYPDATGLTNSPGHANGHLELQGLTDSPGSPNGHLEHEAAWSLTTSPGSAKGHPEAKVPKSTKAVLSDACVSGGSGSRQVAPVHGRHRSELASSLDGAAEIRQVCWPDDVQGASCGGSGSPGSSCLSPPSSSAVAAPPHIASAGGSSGGSGAAAAAEEPTQEAGWLFATWGAALGWPDRGPWRGAERQYRAWRLAEGNHTAVLLFLWMDGISSFLVCCRTFAAMVLDPNTPAKVWPALLVFTAIHVPYAARSVLLLAGPRWLWRHRSSLSGWVDFGVTSVVPLLWLCEIGPGGSWRYLLKMGFAAADKLGKVQVIVLWYILLRVSMQRLHPPALLVSAVCCTTQVFLSLGPSEPERFWDAAGGQLLPGWVAALLALVAAMGTVVWSEARSRLQFLRTSYRPAVKGE